MIAFDLRCGVGHVFEAWFSSGAGYEAQVAAGQVACPVCGDTAIGKAAMAPNLGAKGNKGDARSATEFVRRLAAAQADALKSSQWVGDGFAARARAMHEGEEPTKAIHGRATLGEAKALAADGVPVAPLPLPVVPPDQVN